MAAVAPRESARNPTVVELLGPLSYLAFLRWCDVAVINNRECVHVAQVHHPKHGGTASFVKLYPPTRAGMRGFVNEICGYLVAFACDLPQPPSASVVPVPLDKLPAGRPPWVDQVVSIARQNGVPHALYPAYCTGPLEGQSAYFSLQGRSPELLRQDVLKWRDLPRVLAFDDAIANVDRHFNNLIRLRRQSYALIDHGRLVHEFGDWEISLLNPLGLFRHRLLELVYRGVAPDDVTVSATLNEADRLTRAMAKIVDDATYWLKRILGEGDGGAFLTFLTDRLANIEQVLRNRHGRLV
jgi:hypothetical protein